MRPARLRRSTGIIHRDLKPANVKVREDGAVKVLDFGLAKAVSPGPESLSDVSASPTITSPAMTRVGVILGTAAYMSPEQARGRPADHRSDIFAFGCVVYEMLTRRQAFQGEDVADVLASVMKIDANLDALPAGIHPRLTALLRRCLAKNPKDRWHAIGDVRAELEEILADPKALAGREPGYRRMGVVAALAAVAALLLVAGTAVVVRKLQPIQSHDIARFVIGLPPGQVFTNTGRQFVAMAPDGSSFVYVANQQLYLRRLSDLSARAVEGSKHVAGLTSPTFSPDSRWIAFWSGGKLQKIAVAGGVPVPLCDAANPAGMSWFGDGIYFGQPPGTILRVSANGGIPAIVVPPTPGTVLYGPQGGFHRVSGPA